MDVLSSSWRGFAGGKPFETFGKGLGIKLKKAEARDDGPTGPAASKHLIG